MYQNLWDAANVNLREKFVALKAYIKQEGIKINNLSFHSKRLEKEEQIKLKTKRRKEIIKIKP